MPSVLGVRFRDIGKIYYYVDKDFKCSVGDFLIVLTRRGMEKGIVKVKKEMSIDTSKEMSNGKIIRKATVKDLGNIQKNEQLEKKFFEICKQKIIDHRLKMKLIECEYLFDRSKLIFYFVADGRVDFRNFVKELAYIFKTRIELRQVGVRDEAKIIGGLGVCGKPLCCATFLNDFQSVSVKMAKDQNITLSPSKISGVCGRLMCCLKFEEEAYLDKFYKKSGETEGPI